MNKQENKATCESNIEEFVDNSGKEQKKLATRLNTTKIIKSEHIKSSVADNQDGPLSASIADSDPPKIFNANEERIRNIESHLGIITVPIDLSHAERIKILEDKILKIEQHYPQIASHVFNYGKAEQKASSKPGGRVSRGIRGTDDIVNISKKKKSQRNI